MKFYSNGENFMKIGPEMTGRIFGKKRALYIIYRKKDICS
jgi:hypothetical protein